MGGREKKAVTLFSVFFVFNWIFTLGSMGVIAYVVYHFISKYW
jgi:phage shock protein PspC (stress-responsive transcriptional regulator)